MPNKLVVGKNDLKSWCIANNRPDILKEWDETRNGVRTPSNTMYGAKYNAWWICPNLHHYQTTMYNRCKENGTGCPFCSGRRVLLGYNDLKTTNPELASQWHPTKNGNLKPESVTNGSNKKIWWLFPYDDPITGKHFDFEWEATIGNRALRGSDCPFLHGRLWQGFNDLLSVNPNLAEEWNTDRNGCSPSEIIANDNRLFWWKCSCCGNEWRARVKNRNILKRGCPQCAKEKQAKSYRLNSVETKGSLAETNPKLASEWHPIKNGNLTPYDITSGCPDKVWWLLPFDDPITGKHFNFEWRASIASRNNGRGCPFLKGKLFKGFNDLTVTNKDIVCFWHPDNNPLGPDNYTKGSHANVWWKGSCGHEFISEIAKQCTHFSCPICSREQSSSFPEQAIYYYVQRLFKESINRDRKAIEGLELDIFIPSKNIAIEYDGVAWHRKPERDAIKSERCHEKGIQLIRVKEQGCVQVHSDYDIVYVYKYADWKMLNNIIESIIRKIGFTGELDIDVSRDEIKIYSLYLGEKKEGSIASNHPELVDLWHPNKNGSLTPNQIPCSSDKVVWWKDGFGHEYRCQVKVMTRGGEHCPFCNNRKLLVGFNDLESKYPQIASEWAGDLNGVLPSQVIYSKGKYWFRCRKCGNTWQALLSNRIRLSVGCPVCGVEKQIERKKLNEKSRYGKSLEVAFPLLALEWDKTKNGIDAKDVFWYSKLSQNYWWKCQVCGHEWKSSIKNRAKGRQCPICSSKKRFKQVRNIEKNEIFLSINEAAEHYNCSASSITNCCKGRIQTCKGYHWEYYKR